MDKPNAIKDKSYSFALAIVQFCTKLMDSHEYVLSKQLLKSGTSIGANVEEALQGQSKKDFIAKLSISLKEAHETNYWLRLLQDSNITQEDTSDLQKNVCELIALLTTIIKSAKSNIESERSII